MQPTSVQDRDGSAGHSGLPWHVLCSKPNKEMVLWRELTARGLDCFYPRLHVKPVDPRSRKVRPYFPGYLFLRADIEQVGLSAFQWMPFSSGMLVFDGIAATVPAHLIEAIRRHVDQINAAGGQALAGLRQGDIVTIQGGPFDGYEAIFDGRLAGTERVRVLLKLLQRRAMRLEVPAALIRHKRR